MKALVKNPLYDAIFREFQYFLLESGANGEVSIASRHALRLGHGAQDLRKTHFLELKFDYCGPKDLANRSSRSDFALLRSHSKLTGATIQPLEVLFNGMERSKATQHTLETVWKEEKAGMSEYVQWNYLAVSWITVFGEDHYTTGKIPFSSAIVTIRPSLFLKFSVPQVYDLKQLPIDDNWPLALKQSLEEPLEPDEESRGRTAKLIYLDSGLSKKEASKLAKEHLDKEVKGYKWNSHSHRF